MSRGALGATPLPDLPRKGGGAKKYGVGAVRNWPRRDGCNIGASPLTFPLLRNGPS